MEEQKQLNEGLPQISTEDIDKLIENIDKQGGEIPIDNLTEYFGSALRQVLAVPGVVKHPNEAMFADKEKKLLQLDEDAKKLTAEAQQQVADILGENVPTVTKLPEGMQAETAQKPILTPAEIKQLKLSLQEVESNIDRAEKKLKAAEKINNREAIITSKRQIANLKIQKARYQNQL